MQKFIFIIAMTMVLIPATLKGSQDTLAHKHRTLIMGVPQHLFDNGVRIEIDKRLPRQNQWITLAPTLYYRGQRGNYFGNYDLYGMKGMGMEVFLRHFLLDQPEPEGFYLSAGAGYRYLQLRHRGDSWNEYMENGLTYYDYNARVWDRQTHSFTLKGTLGYQTILNRHLLIDLFMGVGLRWSEQTIPSDIVLIHDTGDVFSYNFRGFLYVVGGRVGIGW